MIRPMESPLVSLLYVIAAVYLLRWWIKDCRIYQSLTGLLPSKVSLEKESPQPVPSEESGSPLREDRSLKVKQKERALKSLLPGATPVGIGLIIIGVLGSLGILAVEVWGEYRLEIVGEQRELLWYAIFPVLCAPIIEELIFRGYLVVTGKGVQILWLSIVGFSLLFSLIHGHLITLGGEGEPWIVWKGDQVKGWFTSGILFVQSFWWYALRFNPWNPHKSILPSICAHFFVNLGVILIKAVQGYVVLH